MFRNLSRVLTIALVMALTVAAFGAQGQTSGGSAVRFVHALPGAGGVDIYVNGDIAISDLEYGEATSYLNIPSGQHTLLVTQSGASDELWTQDIDAPNGAATTFIVSSVDPLTFTAFNEDLNPIALGKARFTAIHAIADAPDVDVLLEDGRPVVPGLAYNTAYGTFDLPALTYNLAVVPSGASLGDALVPAEPFNLDSGTSYIVLAYGTEDAPEVLLLAAATRAEAADSGSLRVAHLIPDAPAVDVFINDTLVAPSVGFGESTAFMSLPTGTYNTSVRVAGSEEVVVSGSVDIATGQATTAQVVGNPENPELVPANDNFATLTADAGWFKLVNTATEGILVSAATEDGTALTSDLPPGEEAAVALQPGTGDIVVSLTVNGETTSSSLDLGAVYGGVFYNAIAIDGSDGADVVLLDPVSVSQSIASAPGTGAIVAALPTEAAPPPTAEPQPTLAPAEPTAAPVAEATATPNVLIRPEATAVPTTAGPTARILLNPGANLHLRLYPSADAFSLGLAPSGATLLVLGREGAPEATPGSTPDPDAEEEEFFDPVDDLVDGEDLDPAETWLNVAYDTDDGGSVVAWVNALYLSVVNPRGGLQRLADLPTVPSNRPGYTQDTAMQPPSAADRTISAFTGNVAPGARVHVRRTPEVIGESLALLPGDTRLTFLGMNEDEDWYFVRFEDANGVVTGWISAMYVTAFEQLGRTVTLERLDELGELVILEGDERGSVNVNVVPTSAVPVDLRDVIVGEIINLNAGANVHLRRSDVETAESLALLPGGTVITVDAQNLDGLWLRATYNGTVGWVSAQFVSLTLNGLTVEQEELPVVDTTPSTATPTATPAA